MLPRHSRGTARAAQTIGRACTIVRILFFCICTPLRLPRYTSRHELPVALHSPVLRTFADMALVKYALHRNLEERFCLALNDRLCLPHTGFGRIYAGVSYCLLAGRCVRTLNTPTTHVWRYHTNTSTLLAGCASASRHERTRVRSLPTPAADLRTRGRPSAARAHALPHATRACLDGLHSFLRLSLARAIHIRHLTRACRANMFLTHLAALAIWDGGFILPDERFICARHGRRVKASSAHFLDARSYAAFAVICPARQQFFLSRIT